MTDLDLMPFGKHKGKPMQDVPADYFHWLWTNANGGSRPEVKQYIAENLEALKMETPDLIWN